MSGRRPCVLTLPQIAPSVRAQHQHGCLVTGACVTLVHLVRRGQFRPDLYYRLDVISLHLPPLRERVQDVAPLARDLAARHAAGFGKGPLEFSPEALAALEAYPWPGNIRELENVLERTILFAEGPRIRAADLPPSLRASAEAAPAALLEATSAASGPPGPLKEIVKEQVQAIERDLIVRGLEVTGGNVTRTAKLLKISRKSLQMKMKEFGLRGEE